MVSTSARFGYRLEALHPDIGGVDPHSVSHLRARRSVRCRGHDYTGPCWYHVTICAAHRRREFGRLARGEVILSPIGRLVVGALDRLPLYLPWIRLGESVVMPNHLHVLIRIWPAQLDGRIPNRERRFSASQAGALSLAVNLLKGDVTKAARRLLSQPTRTIWHRGYHERIIRTREQMVATRAYIRKNLARG